MKKLLLSLICVVFCLSLSGCFENDVPRNEEELPLVQDEAEEKIFGLNESAVFKDLKFTCLQISESQGDSFFVPEADKVFVGFEFEIENISNAEQTVSTLLLFDCCADDTKCDYSLSAACVFDEGSLDGNIAPGKKMVGWYAVEVPKDWKQIDLHIKSNWLSSGTARFEFKK